MSTKQVRKIKVVLEKSSRAPSLTTADLVVLSLIRERPMHGYELVKEYERQDISDWACVSRPHVYYALQKLADGGYVNAITSSSTPDARGKAVYRITQAGRHALTAGLSSDAWAQNRTPTPFDTWLGLSMHARHADRRRVLSARRAYLTEQIAKEKRTATQIAVDSGGRARIAAVMVGLCIEKFETELKWLTALEKVLLSH